jgi:tetratricopeptide (TPR) repeat protein
MKKTLVVIFIFLFSFLSFLGNVTDCRNHFEAAQWIEKGIKDFSNTKYDDAINAFNKALAMDPNNEEAYYNRGFVYFWIGKWNQAIEDYSKAISLNPKEAKFFSSRGYAYASTGQDDQAIEDYNRAIFRVLFSSRGHLFWKRPI